MFSSIRCDHCVPTITIEEYQVACHDEGKIYISESTPEPSKVMSRKRAVCKLDDKLQQASPQKPKILDHEVPLSPKSTRSVSHVTAGSVIDDPFDTESNEPAPLIPGVDPTCCNCQCILQPAVAKSIYVCSDGRRRRFCMSCPSPRRPKKRSLLRKDREDMKCRRILFAEPDLI